MDKNHTQLSLVKRDQIKAFLNVVMRKKKIAQEIWVHPSAIRRELARNTAKRGRTAGEYVADNTQRKTEQRLYNKPKVVKFSTQMKDQDFSWPYVEKWSLEIIRVQGHKTGKCPLSIETLYQWIWECKNGNKATDKPYKKMYTHLKHGRRRRKRGNKKDSRGIIHNRVFIEKRPKIVQKRSRPDDFEVDFMMGKSHEGALLVITDMASLHTSQYKGKVENHIGQLRRFFPKKTELSGITDQRVKQVKQLLNDRPVRKIKYKTPNQVLQEKNALIT